MNIERDVLSYFLPRKNGLLYWQRSEEGKVGKPFAGFDDWIALPTVLIQRVPRLPKDAAIEISIASFEGESYAQKMEAYQKLEKAVEETYRRLRTDADHPLAHMFSSSVALRERRLYKSSHAVDAE